MDLQLDGEVEPVLATISTKAWRRTRRNSSQCDYHGHAGGLSDSMKDIIQLS